MLGLGSRLLSLKRSMGRTTGAGQGAQEGELHAFEKTIRYMPILFLFRAIHYCTCSHLTALLIEFNRIRNVRVGVVHGQNHVIWPEPPQMTYTLCSLLLEQAMPKSCTSEGPVY